MSEIRNNLYVYKATLDRAVDGDTVRLNIDLGLSTERKSQEIRLLYVDTPERGKPNYKEAKAYTQSKLENRQLYVETFKDNTEKYGRYLGEVYYENDDGDLINYNHELQLSGLLKPDSKWNRSDSDVIQ